MDAELSCPLCNCDYAENNPPRMLTHCGHTYCQRCLDSLCYNQDEQTRLKCPQDQRILQLNGNVQSLPRNLALVKYLDSKSKSMSNSFKDDSSFDVSKITKNQEFQEDQDAQELITVIDGRDPTDSVPTWDSKRGQDTPKQAQLSQADNQVMIPNQTIPVQINHPQAQMCLLHQKPIQVVCMSDLQRLCSKCAIFGQHKGHEFRSLQEMDSTNKKFSDQIISVFAEKSFIQERLTHQVTEKQLIQILSVKGKKLKKQIADKFKKIAEELVKAQKSAYKKLQDVMQEVEKKLKKLLVIDQNFIIEYSKWQFASLQKITDCEQRTHDGILHLYLQGSDIIQNGKGIVKKLKDQQDLAFSEADKLIQNLGAHYSENNCVAAINSMVQVYESQKNDKVRSNITPLSFVPNKEKENQRIHANRDSFQLSKPAKLQNLHQNDQSLLELDEYDDHCHTQAPSLVASRLLNESFTKQQIKKQQPSTSQKTNRPPIQSTSRMSLQRKKTINTNISKQLDKSKDLGQTSQSVFGREAIKKKLRGLKIPQKYEKVIEGIMTDTLDTVDLTNAQLGDASIFQICDLLKNNNRCKTLKLIRNKLTDEGIVKLLPFLTNIITLNLSQNLLTENSLNMISQIRSQLPCLKAVILSQNKIAERKSKTMIDKLRKMDLTISI